MRTSARVFLLAAVCVLSLTGCRQQERQVDGSHSLRPDRDYPNCRSIDGSPVCDPSLYELIARPDWYDGKTVYVAGVLDPDREAFLLFAGEDAYRMYVQRSAVLLTLGRDSTGQDYSRVAGRWALVLGKYSASGRGSAGHFSGVITGIRSITPYASPRVPVAK
jgi:hypothetical protein